MLEFSFKICKMYQLLNELGLVENDFQVYRHALILHQFILWVQEEMFKPISGLFGQVHVLEKWPNMIKLNYFRGGYLLNTGYTMASYGYSTDVGI